MSLCSCVLTGIVFLQAPLIVPMRHASLISMTVSFTGWCSFFMMWPAQWFNFCAMFPVEVRVVGVFLFRNVLLMLSALPYFPAGHTVTLFTSSLRHGHHFRLHTPFSNVSKLLSLRNSRFTFSVCTDHSQVKETC